MRELIKKLNYSIFKNAVISGFEVVCGSNFIASFRNSFVTKRIDSGNSLRYNWEKRKGEVACCILIL